MKSALVGLLLILLLAILALWQLDAPKRAEQAALTEQQRIAAAHDEAMQRIELQRQMDANRARQVDAQMRINESNAEALRSVWQSWGLVGVVFMFSIAMLVIILLLVRSVLTYLHEPLSVAKRVQVHREE